MRGPLDLYLVVYSVYTKLAKHASYFAYNFSCNSRDVGTHLLTFGCLHTKCRHNIGATLFYISVRFSLAVCMDGSFYRYLFTTEAGPSNNCIRDSFDIFLDIGNDGI